MLAEKKSSSNEETKDERTRYTSQLIKLKETREQLHKKLLEAINYINQQTETKRELKNQAKEFIDKINYYKNARRRLPERIDFYHDLYIFNKLIRQTEFREEKFTQLAKSTELLVIKLHQASRAVITDNVFNNLLNSFNNYQLLNTASFVKWQAQFIEQAKDLKASFTKRNEKIQELRKNNKKLLARTAPIYKIIEKYQDGLMRLMREIHADDKDTHNKMMMVFKELTFAKNNIDYCIEKMPKSSEPLANDKDFIITKQLYKLWHKNLLDEFNKFIRIILQADEYIEKITVGFEVISLEVKEQLQQLLLYVSGFKQTEENQSDMLNIIGNIEQARDTVQILQPASNQTQAILHKSSIITPLFQEKTIDNESEEKHLENELNELIHQIEEVKQENSTLVSAIKKATENITASNKNLKILRQNQAKLEQLMVNISSEFKQANADFQQRIKNYNIPMPLLDCIKTLQHLQITLTLINNIITKEEKNSIVQECTAELINFKRSIETEDYPLILRTFSIELELYNELTLPNQNYHSFNEEEISSHNNPYHQI